MRRGSAQDFMEIPVRGFRPEASATPPANPQAGRCWTDTSVTPNKVRWFDGVNWVAADGSSIPAGFINDAMISSSAAISLTKLATDPLNRANHTGAQTAATISDFNTAVRASRLDQFSAPTNSVDFNGVRLTSVASPVGGTDAANKSYVDNARAGISVKDPVRVVAQGNINLTSPGGVIDNVALGVGDRFLAARQNVGTENGIYVFNGPTTAATRAPDDSTAGQVADGSMVAVAEGTDDGHQYIQTATASGTPGSWTQNWVLFSTGGQTYTAGSGLTLSGTTFSLIAPVTVTLGGTGANTPAAARVNLGAVGKYAADLGVLNAGTTYTINHGLNTFDVIAAFRTTADSRLIEFDWAPASASTVSVFPDVGFSAGAIRATIVG